jgi:hypothetical protein
MREVVKEVLEVRYQRQFPLESWFCWWTGELLFGTRIGMRRFDEKFQLDVKGERFRDRHDVPFTDASDGSIFPHEQFLGLKKSYERVLYGRKRHISLPFWEMNSNCIRHRCNFLLK